MRIWFDVNRYESKNYPTGNLPGNKKSRQKAAYLLKTIVLLFAFFVLADDKFNVTFDLCLLCFR